MRNIDWFPILPALYGGIMGAIISSGTKGFVTLLLISAWLIFTYIYAWLFYLLEDEK